ncbi:MAG TPA: hypothetical protein VK938_08305 [Methylophilaceae bacterium]|jgi:hypothetical protein|nr:hypothetical protein [Methylophilaceae bacterium]
MTKRQWSDADWQIVVRLNAVPVTKEELWDLVGEAEELSAEQRAEAGGGMFLIASRYKGDPQKAQAVYFRMEALSRLLEAEGAPGWTLPKQPDGSIPIQEAVFAAAAFEPLTRVGEEIGFDSASFLRRVLSEAESEGNA